MSQAAHAQTKTASQNKNLTMGIAPSNANPLAMERAIPATPFQWFASTDPKHRNADYLVLKPGETRRIPLAAGTLLRLWSTSLFPDQTTLILQNKTRIPLIENGKARVGELHEKAFTLYPYMPASALRGPSTKLFDKVRVLAPDAALIVTNNAKTESKFFYQVAIAPISASTPQVIAPSTGDEKDTIDGAIVNLKAGEEKVFWNASTRGTIEAIIIRFKQPPADRNALRLRATWDENEKQNAIDVPLGAFAANFHGSFPLTKGFSDTGLWAHSAKSLLVRALMPFTKGAKLTLTNNGATDLSASTRVSWHAISADAPLRFCARFGTAQTQKGKPLDILSAQGSGAFLGFSLGVKPLPSSARRAFAYLEGNETIEADGRSYEGTGTEDFFNAAWYFPKKPFAKLLYGLTFKQDLPPQFSAYRLMIPDAVPFQKNLRVTLEHGNRNNTDDLQYSWVAYWYQKTPLNFSIEEAAPQNAAAESEDGASKKSSPVETAAAGLGVILLAVAALILRWKMAPKKS